MYTDYLNACNADTDRPPGPVPKHLLEDLSTTSQAEPRPLGSITQQWQDEQRQSQQQPESWQAQVRRHTESRQKGPLATEMLLWLSVDFTPTEQQSKLPGDAAASFHLWEVRACAALSGSRSGRWHSEPARGQSAAAGREGDPSPLLAPVPCGVRATHAPCGVP